MPVTSAWGIGVPLGPTTCPVIVPLVRGGLGARVGRSGLVGRPSWSGGTL